MLTKGGEIKGEWDRGVADKSSLDGLHDSGLLMIQVVHHLSRQDTTQHRFNLVGHAGNLMGQTNMTYVPDLDKVTPT